MQLTFLNLVDLETTKKEETILRDLFIRQPEALKAFREEIVKLKVVLEGDSRNKFFIEIWNSKKRVSFARKNAKDDDIEVFIDDLRNELIDLKVKLPPFNFSK